MWPAAFWEKLYEPLIRRAAGLGRARRRADPDHYEKAYALLRRAGDRRRARPGLPAALAAGRAGARVILCDEDFRLGGRLLAERYEIDGAPGARLGRRRPRPSSRACPTCRILRRTTVFGVYDGGTYGALERVNDHLPAPPAHQPRQRLWRIVAKRAVLAAGAIERPIVFGGNDRPGVMLAGAVRTYLNRYGVAPGRRAVVFTNNDDGWRTAERSRAGRRRRSRRSSMRARASRRASQRGREDGGMPVSRGRRDQRRARRRTACRGVEVARCERQRPSASTATCSPSPAAGTRRSHLTTHLSGKPLWNEALAALRARRRCRRA